LCICYSYFSTCSYVQQLSHIIWSVCVLTITRNVGLERLTFPNHTSYSPLLVGFVHWLVVFCPFPFRHCMVYSLSIYGFWILLLVSLNLTWIGPFSFTHCMLYPFMMYGSWLPCWYLQTFLKLDISWTFFL
jgi:hypothetical protein